MIHDNADHNAQIDTFLYDFCFPANSTVVRTLYSLTVMND